MTEEFYMHKLFLHKNPKIYNYKIVFFYHKIAVNLQRFKYFCRSEFEVVKVDF